MSATIRLASNQDVPGIVRVVKAVYDEYGFTWDAEDYHADLYDIEGHYLTKGWPFFVAELDGEIVGTAALAFHNRIADGDTVEFEEFIRVGGSDCSFERLYVDPNARRAGIGRGLVERVFAEARDKGCKRMELWSDKRFEDAHRLYQKLGATVVGERICHDPDQSPEWGLAIDL